MNGCVIRSENCGVRSLGWYHGATNILSHQPLRHCHDATDQRDVECRQGTEAVVACVVHGFICFGT